MAVALRRVKRAVEVDLDNEELAKVVRAAQLYAAGKSQQAIADTFPTSVSTVARWLNRAMREGILETRVVPPPVFHLQAELGPILAGDGVGTVIVVPNGPEKNTANLGWAGARHVMQAIDAQIARDPAGDTITIALSCGTTVTSVIENLIDMLYHRQVVGRGGAPISHKLEIYPAVLFGDSAFDPVYPHTIVTYFAMLARNAELTLPGSPEPLISGHALQLPKGFYTRQKSERDDYKERWGLNDFVDTVGKADIFVLGAGNLTAASYGKISQQLGIKAYLDKLKNKAAVQILYAPLMPNGLPEDEVSEKIIGLTVKQIKNIALDHSKQVILVAGGEEKVKSMQRVIDFPCYNVLITDVAVATEALRQRPRKEKKLS